MDLGKQIIGGLFTGMVIIVLLIAFFGVLEIAQKDASPELNKTLEQTKENVVSSVNWFFILSGIIGFITIIIGVFLWLKNQGLIGEQNYTI